MSIQDEHAVVEVEVQILRDPNHPLPAVVLDFSQLEKFLVTAGILDPEHLVLSRPSFVAAGVSGKLNLHFKPGAISTILFEYECDLGSSRGAW